MKKFFFTLRQWVDNGSAERNTISARNYRQGVYQIDWLRAIPFLALHLAALGIFFVPFGWFGVAVCLFTFWFRLFAITAFYHRYFSHRTYKCNRVWQFVFALLGATAVQRGPLWWAAQHRYHHRHADQTEDKHSPRQHGFWRSHCGWFLSRANFYTDFSYIKDFSQFPELKFLNRFDVLIPVLFACSLFLAGEFLGKHFPVLHTSGSQLLFYGFFLSTVLTWHATFTVNSLNHIFGKQRYKTKDESRNNPWLALLTLGEGWHNNHHYFCGSARQGFYWYEVDITYYLLKCLAFLNIIYDLKTIPASVRDRTIRGNRS